MPSEPTSRCHCGRVGLYRARPQGAAYCRAHRGEAERLARAISTALEAAHVHELHNWREGYRHDPVAAAWRWR